MPKILLNYRRDDTAPYAGRIADRLRHEFGPDQVFVDIDTIRPGEDFVDAIERSVASCDVLVALIGKSWLTITDDTGNRRLDRADDFVRMEIVKALERRVRVIPVLVGGAVMPKAKDLPQDMATLWRRHAIEISDNRFHQDVDRLIRALSGAAVDSRPAHHPAGVLRSSFVWLIGLVVAALIALVGYRALGPGTGTTRERLAPMPNSSVGTTAVPQSERGQAGALGVVNPSRELERPGATTDAPGKTGIKVVWRGANSVPCYLYDATGEKVLSPSSEFLAWRCAANGATWDAAPGRYQLKIGDVTKTIAPIPLTVTIGRVTAIEPQLGQLRLHWNGSNRVFWYLLDKTGEKTLSPRGFQAWSVGSGKTSTADLGPGDYVVKVDAVGYQPVKVRVETFRATDVTIP